MLDREPGAGEAGRRDTNALPRGLGARAWSESTWSSMKEACRVMPARACRPTARGPPALAEVGRTGETPRTGDMGGFAPATAAAARRPSREEPWSASGDGELGLPAERVRSRMFAAMAQQGSWFSSDTLTKASCADRTRARARVRARTHARARARTDVTRRNAAHRPLQGKRPRRVRGVSLWR